MNTVVALARRMSARSAFLAFALALALLLQPISPSLAVDETPPPPAAPAPENTPPLGVPRISIGKTTPEPASKTTTYRDIKLEYLDPGEPQVRIDKIVVKQADAATTTGLAAAEIEIEGLVVLQEARVLVVIDRLQARNVAAPSFTADALGLATRLGDLPPLVDFLMATKADSVVIETLQVPDRGPGNGIGVRHVELTKLDAGRIAEFQAGPLKFIDTFGSEGGRFLALRRLDIHNLDFNVLAAWLDDKAASSAGAGHALYKDLTFDTLSWGDPGITFLIDRVASTNLGLSGPPLPPSNFWDLIGKLNHPASAGVPPADIVSFWQGMLATPSIETLELTRGKMIVSGRPPAMLEQARLEKLTGAGFAAFDLRDLDFADTSYRGPSIVLASLSLCDFKVVAIDRFLASVAKDVPAYERTLADMPQPRLGSLSADDVRVLLPGQAMFSVKAVRLEAPAWIGFLPTAIKARVEALAIPALTLADSSLRTPLRTLGLNVLEINASLEASWKEADLGAEIGPVVVDVANLGKVEAHGGIAGVPKSLFEAPDTIGDVIPALDLRKVSLSLADKGGLAAVFDLIASTQSSTRQEMADMISKKSQLFMIGVLGLDESAYQVGSALKAFIANPKSISVDAVAAPPLSVEAAGNASGGDAAAVAKVQASVKITASANK